MISSPCLVNLMIVSRFFDSESRFHVNLRFGMFLFDMTGDMNKFEVWSGEHKFEEVVPVHFASPIWFDKLYHLWKHCPCLLNPAT